jgi:hypothetical protein
MLGSARPTTTGSQCSAPANPRSPRRFRIHCTILEPDQVPQRTLSTMIFPGSRLERQKDGSSWVGAVGRRDGGSPAMGSARVTHGRQPAVC